MPDQPDTDRLKALEARLAAKREGEPDAPSEQAQYHSQAEMAWRMVSMLVAALIVGFVFGFGLDIVLGTRPWLMAVFTVLGLAAGMLSVIRIAQAMQGTQDAASAAETEKEGAKDGD